MTGRFLKDRAGLICCGILIGCFSFFKVFENQELATYDWRLAARGAQKVSDRIAVIEIADDTIQGLGEWPISRHFHAALVDILKELGAKRVIFDILFSESGNYDEALAESFAAAGNVYLPTAFFIEDAPGKVVGPVGSSQVLGGIAPTLARAAAGRGHINTFVDPDGKIRRIPLFIRYADTDVSSLALRAAADEMGLDLKSIEAGLGRVPFLVNYPGVWAKTFRHYSFLEILKSWVAERKGQESFLDLSALKGKICLVGLTATGTSDIRPNSLEKVYPMVGLQASVLNSFLLGSFLTEADPWVNVAISLVVYLLALWICWAFLPWRAFVGSAALAGVITATATALFVFKGYWIDLFLPLVVIGLTYAISLFYRFLNEARQRELLEKELEIAAAIQKSFLPQEIPALGGVAVTPFLQPAKFVAGDLYDVFVLPNNKLGVFIGDVAGKGVSAALVMAQTISLLRIFAQRSDDPAQVLVQLNKELCTVLAGRFVTAQYLVIDPAERSISGACAGHPPVLFLSRSQGVVAETLSASGPPLGLDPGSAYETVRLSCASRDRIFLYTDGWTEARDEKGLEFGVTHLKEILFKNKDFESAQVLEEFKQARAVFEGRHKQHDDITAILVDMP